MGSFSFHTDGNHSSFHPGSNSIRLLPFHLATTITSGCHHFPPGCITSGILLPPPFHPNVHIRNSAAAAITPGCFTSGILTSDGRGERFNLPGHTYPDPLIALTQRVSQPFCTVPRCLLKLPDMCDQHFEIF